MTSFEEYLAWQLALTAKLIPNPNWQPPERCDACEGSGQRTWCVKPFTHTLGCRCREGLCWKCNGRKFLERAGTLQARLRLHDGTEDGEILTAEGNTSNQAYQAMRDQVLGRRFWEESFLGPGTI